MNGRKILGGKLLCMALVFLVSACGGRSKQQEEASSKNSVEISSLERGKSLIQAGNHLVACSYFEASLAQGEEEETVLPLLAGAQIRAGRFLAARVTMKRLVKIKPSHPHAEDLLSLLEHLLTGRFTNPAQNESVQ